VVHPGSRRQGRMLAAAPLLNLMMFAIDFSLPGPPSTIRLDIEILAGNDDRIVTMRSANVVRTQASSGSRAGLPDLDNLLEAGGKGTLPSGHVRRNIRNHGKQGLRHRLFPQADRRPDRVLVNEVDSLDGIGLARLHALACSGGSPPSVGHFAFVPLIAAEGCRGIWPSRNLDLQSR